MQNKIIPFEGLSDTRLVASSCQEKIVHAHGVFDILHAGHLAYFQSAKKFGDVLVVTITSDKYVNKGPGRPVFTQDIRARMLAALEVVDFVSISDYPTATQVIEKLKPDYYVKGPDYRDKTKDITKEIYNEEMAVEKAGGKLVFTDDETFSSSTLANRFFVKWSDQQQVIINRIKELGGLEKINQILDQIADLRVTVIGEPIIDIYRFVEPENISSKSPSVSAKFLYEESYEGGATAIVKHIRSFVAAASLCYPFGFKDPKKIRYIAVDKSQRIFEVTETETDLWVNKDSQEFLKIMKYYSGNNDVTILADFGHGLFEGEILKAAGELNSFVALNVQTNSSNAGFNPFTKHKSFDYLSLDTRELRVAYHDRQSSPVDLMNRARKDTGVHVSLTAGSNGAYFNDHFSPAFADQVIDATGAGDAYFAITSLLVKVGAPSEMIPFLGNVFAGLKTKIIGNKSAVTKAQFVKALEGILK